MAALRPVTLLFQEFATVSTPAAVPTLSTVIVGPAYHIADYPDDAATNSGGTYGSRTADNIVAGGGAEGLPVSGSDAIVLADPPGNAVGAILDADSVEIWMDDVHLQIVADDGIVGDFSTTAPNENLFTAGSGEDFYALGVRVGDLLISTGTAGDNETISQTIMEVGGEPGGALEGSADSLRVTANYAAAGLDISGVSYSGGDPENRHWRVERVVSGIELSSSFIEIIDNEIAIKGGITHLIDIDEDDTDEAVTVVAADLYVSYRSLRQDLSLLDEISDPDLIEARVGRIDERNPLAVGLHVALQNTGTPIKYVGIQTDSLNGNVDRLSGYQGTLSELAARSDIFGVVPLSADPSVIAALQTHVNTMADPERAKFRCVIGSVDILPAELTIADASTTGTTENYGADIVNVVVTDHSESFSDAGVRAGDKLYIVADGVAARVGEHTIAEVYTKGDAVRLEDAITVGTGTAGERYYVLRGTGQVNRVCVATAAADTGTTDFSCAEALATDVGKVLRLTGGVTDESPSGNQDFLITAFSAGVWTVEADANWTLEPSGLTATILDPITSTVDVSTPSTPVIEDVSLDTRKPFRQLLDASASFITDGVVVGDILEVVYPPEASGTDFDTAYTAVIAEVISENRVLLAANSDIPVTSSDVVQTATVGNRVVRALSRSAQVTELVSIPQGYSDTRVVLVFPDLCDVAGVQNNKTGVASPQPTCYLACAVGAMSASLPAHQGFTNLQVAGVSAVHNSSRYFDDDQITELSNAGFYLFLQATRSSAPYCLHQLTTDTSTVKLMEFSCRRTYDKVSRFYQDIVDDFIGRYNVTPEVLDVLRASINGGTDQLKTEKFPRIGTPIISATIASVEILDGASDRVEIYMDIDFPNPLNRVGLHLRA